MNIEDWLVVGIIVVAFAVILLDSIRQRHLLERHCTLCNQAYNTIERMLNLGYIFDCGQHTVGLAGYYAKFSQPVCEQCEECGALLDLTDYWPFCGHADTLSEAILMASAVATGQEVKIPTAEEFLQ